jgi:NAD(P)-dependent dehydrogenase (short-subunit alcohol dehydrogenase family)
MRTRFDQKVVWITGATSGIGRSCAFEFAREGATLSLAGRRRERLDDMVSELGRQGHTALATPCDVTDESSVQHAIDQTVQRFGRLDVVLACAGFGVAGKFEDLALEDWRRQFDTNVFGLISTVKHSLPELRKSNGRIALVGSVAAFLYAPGTGAYSASKAAVQIIGETLSAELAGSGVTCTTIHPGFIDTEIMKVDKNGVYRDELPDGRPAALIWKSDDAARVMVRAIHRRKREFIFTGHGKIAAFVGRHFPSLVARAWTMSSTSAFDKQ